MNTKTITILLLFVIFIFLFLIFDWTMSSIIHRRQEVMLPSITGKSISEALDILSPHNLGLKKSGSEYHPELPMDTVTRQDPPGGMIVREGKIVKVSLSQGSELVFVPNITGETVRRAELAMRKSKLNVLNKKEIYSLKFEKDTVISQNPAPNSIVNKNTPIELVISLGKPADGTILMPAFIGRSISEVKQWGEANNIYCEFSEEYQSAPPGTVVHQEPIADSVVASTTAVSVIISAYGSNALEKSSSGSAVHYEVPQGKRNQAVRMILIDNNGEREIFSNIQAPGSKIDLVVPTDGKARLRILLNNILVEERDL